MDIYTKFIIYFFERVDSVNSFYGEHVYSYINDYLQITVMNK